MHPLTPPAGWYPAPGEFGHERRWDGTEWTEERREAAMGHHAVPPAATQSGLREHQVVMLAFGAIFLFLVLVGLGLPLMVFR